MLSSGDLMTIWRKYFHKAQDTVHIAAAWANGRNPIVVGGAVLQEEDVVKRFRREWRQADALGEGDHYIHLDNRRPSQQGNIAETVESNRRTPTGNHECVELCRGTKVRAPPWLFKVIA